MTQHWGADSYLATYTQYTNGAGSDTLAKYVSRYSGGNVVFWARYFYPSALGSRIGWDTNPAQEVQALRDTGINWLVPISSPPGGTAGNYNSGANDAYNFCQAIANGIDAGIGMYLPTLRLDSSGNPILRVYLDLEPGQILSQDYWNGWAYTVRSFPYRGKNPFFPCA